MILYELLTGKYPYPVTGNVVDVLRTITEVEPSPPSRQWTPDVGMSAARSRRRLRAGECPIDNEVHTIVLKTLSKDRDRRYQSARELAADVRRYLANEPIEAKRDSGWYVLKKTLRRYRFSAGVLFAFFVVIALSLVATSSLWRQSNAEAREKQQALVALDRLLTDGVDKLRDADVDEAVRWLHTYQQIASDTDVATAFSRSRKRFDDFEQEVRKRLDGVLAANRLDSVVRLARQQPHVLLDVFDRMDARSNQPETVGSGLDMRARLVNRLERLLTVPMAVGQMQTVLDACSALEELAPDNEHIRKFQDRQQALLGQLTTILAERFDTYAASDDLGQWIVAEDNHRHVTLVESGLEMRSTESWTVSVSHPLDFGATDDQPVTVTAVAKIRFTYVPEYGEAPLPLRAGLYLVLPDGRRADALLWPAGQLAETRRSEGIVPIEIHDLPKEPLFQVSLHVDVKNATYDLAVAQLPDGDAPEVVVHRRLARENIPLNQTDPGAIIKVECAGGVEAVVDDIVVRAGTTPLKRNWDGRLPPLISASHDGPPVVSASSFTPVACTGMVVHDIDGDGQLEVIASTDDPGDRLTTFDVVDSSESCSLRNVGTSDFVASPIRSLRPTGIFNRCLVCTGNASKADPEDQSGACRLLLLQPDTERGFKFVEVSSHDFRETAIDVTMTPLRTGSVQKAFAVGTAAYSCEVRSFRTDDNLRLHQRWSFPAVVLGGTDAPDRSEPCNVTSLASCDRDADGKDDILFLGLSNWVGYCPAMVDLRALRSAPDEPVEVRRLTDEWVGATHVAVSRLDSPDWYLIAASGTEKRNIADRFGVRVWRVDALDDGPAFPVIPCDARALAVGKIHGRDVIAVASVEEHREIDCQNLVVCLYGCQGELIEELWRATWYDWPLDRGVLGVVGLYLVDLNDRGERELLVSLTDYGLLVFSADYER